MTQRQVWQDAAKGIGIVLVVFGHVVMGMRDAGVLAAGSEVAWLLYAIYLFHMPLFFLLAGLNVEHSLGHGVSGYLRGKLWTVVYPYFLWSLLQGGVQMALAGDLNGSIGLSNLLSIGWAPFAQFWFLWSLAVCHVAILVLPRRGVALFAVAVAAAVASPWMPYPLEKTLFNFFFYAIGLLLARRASGWQPAWSVLAWLSASFAGAVIVNAYVADLVFDQTPALPAALAGIAMVATVSKLVRGCAANFMQALGRMSMTIYILHILAAAGTRVALLKLHVPGAPWFHVAIATVAGIALPVLAHRVLARLGWLSALGLAAPARRERLRHAPGM